MREEQKNSFETWSYDGLLGLDRLDVRLKFINFIVTIAIGIKLSLSWRPYIFHGGPAFQLLPCGWPLLLLLAWPVCAVILWLRVTGISWPASVLAGILVTALSVIWQSLVEAAYDWLA